MKGASADFLAHVANRSMFQMLNMAEKIDRHVHLRQLGQLAAKLRRKFLQRTILGCLKFI